MILIVTYSADVRISVPIIMGGGSFAILPIRSRCRNLSVAFYTMLLRVRERPNERK